MRPLSLGTFLLPTLFALLSLACGESETGGQGGGQGDGVGEGGSGSQGAGGEGTAGGGGATAGCVTDTVVCEGTILVECPAGTRTETDCAATGQICHAEMRHCM